MKIELEVPDWAIGRHIHIFAGAELLATKEVRVHKDHSISYLPLKVKPETGRCSGCSSCCEEGASPRVLAYMKERLKFFDPDKDKDEVCPFLENDGCGLRGFIPFSCVKSVCTIYEGCTERMEEVE